MKVRLFVISGSALLSLWLAVTFMHSNNLASYRFGLKQDVAEVSEEAKPVDEAPEEALAFAE